MTRRNLIIASLNAGALLCFLLIPHLPWFGVIACTVIGFGIHVFATLSNFPIFTPTDSTPPPSDSEPWRHSDTGKD